jgi:hypothetical protein
MLPTPSYMSLCLFLDFFSPPHLHVDPEGLLGVICALNLSPHVLAVVYDAHVPLPSQRSMVPVLVYKTRQYPACKNGFMHTAVPSASASACMCVQKPSALIQESSSLSQSGTRIQVAVRFFSFFLLGTNYYSIVLHARPVTVTVRQSPCAMYVTVT